MRCEEVRSLIKEYHNQTIDEYTRIKIHHHLVDCPSCTEDYEMWHRGEEYIKLPMTEPEAEVVPSTGLLHSVMSRIEKEQKWANPSVKKNIPLTGRLKLFGAFLVSIVLLSSLLFFFVSLSTEIETPAEHVIRLDMIGESWKIDEVVMPDDGDELESETSMEFQVVASLSDPIIYTLAEEKKTPPYMLILAIFFGLLVILGFSWITRTE